MPLELTQPWLLLGLLALPVLVWYCVRGLTDFSRWQRVTSLVARTLVLVLLVAALCGLTWLKPSQDLYVVFAIDDSLSVGDEARPEVEKFLDRATAAAGASRYAFVRFGVAPGPVTADRAGAGPADRLGTDIAAALEVATAAAPPSHV
ncbi:MAG: von Willebrand factor type domain protein, partial [Gemmataceae bacterium]|nr:von Willebrand factor type domain protein [Gemmataceae bacterium]